MTLQDYYKAHLYDYGYNNGYDKLDNAVGSTDYDEFDYYIISDYVKLYNVSDKDVEFMRALGFNWEELKK